MAGDWCFRTWAFIGLVLSVLFQLADSYAKPTTESPAGTGKICDTPECVIAAAAMIKKMNTSADPCQDFNEFACGRFITETIIPDGKSRVATISVLADENKVTLKAIIVENATPTEPRYLTNIKRYYNSCIDEAQIEALGLAPYLNDQAFVDDWPILNPRWSGSRFDLNQVIIRYMRVFIQPLFSTSVTNDMADSNTNVVYLGEGVLELQMEYYRRPRNDSVLVAYEKYLTDTAVELGANRTVAEQDAKDFVDLEVELAKIMVPREERRDSRKLLNPVKLNELSSLYPQLDIARAIRAVFSSANLTLADDERVINLFPTYIGNISSVVQRFSNRTVQNLFGFKYALARVGSLTRRMREIRLDFDRVKCSGQQWRTGSKHTECQVYAGTTTENPRWQGCVEATSIAFWKGMSRQFVNRRFSESAKIYVNGMIDNLDAEFKKMLEEATWMSQPTKEEAFKKLAAMTRKIGYPDVDFEEADIEQYYVKYIMDEDDFYNNRILGNNLNYIYILTTLRQPVEDNPWPIPPYDVNAFYSWFENEIVFLAGILQPVFFSETFQDYANYGAIGSIIGHEITHGFDDQGSQYDANGTLRNWWTAADRENFTQRTKCIVDQNSNFHVDEIDLNLNGINTQGESVADTGGLKESYRAYQQHVRRSGQQLPMPGLQLSPDQLFFLAFAQMHCDKWTPQRLITQVTTGVHPPGEYRIIGTLQNSEYFAKAYNCPRGSFMNPEKKCGVW